MGNLMDKGSMAVLNPTSPEYSKLLAGISANIPNILNRIISRLRSGSNSSNSPTCIPDVDILQIVDLEQCGLRHRIFHCFLLLEVAGVHMGQDCAQKILVYFIENYDVYENSSSDVLGFMNYKASSSGSVFVDIIVRLRTCFQYYPSLFRYVKKLTKHNRFRSISTLPTLLHSTYFSEAIKSIMDDISGYIIEVKSGQEPSSSFSPIKLYNILTNLHSLCCYDISSLPVSSYSYSRKLLPRLLLPYWDRLYDISLLKIGKDESISVDLHAVSLDLCSSIIEFEASVSVRIETRPVLRRALSMKELSCSPKDDCLLSNTSLCGSIGLRSVAAFYIVVRTSAEVDENKIRGVVLSNYTPDSSSSSLAPPSDPMSDKEVNGNLISSFSSQERALRSRRMVKSTKSMIANLSLFPQTFFMLFDALLEYSYLSLPSLRTIATQSSGGNYSSVSNKVNGGDTLMPSTNVEDALCLLHSVKPVVEGGSKETGASIHFSSQVANNSLFKPKIEKAELTRRNVKRVETQRYALLILFSQTHLNFFFSCHLKTA